MILAFGLYDRFTSAPDTFGRNLGRLLEVAETRFPRALVFVPAIPYDLQLPEAERDRLDEFNQLIYERPNYLLSPDPQQVETVDDVHWTPTTASLVWRMWRGQLNLAPTP